MVFKVFQQILLPFTIINFVFASLKLLTNFENAYWNPSQNSLLLADVLSADLLLAAGKKCVRVNLSQAASCKHFQCQNRRFRVFEAGYLKDRVSEAG